MISSIWLLPFSILSVGFIHSYCDGYLVAHLLFVVVWCSLVWTCHLSIHSPADDGDFPHLGSHEQSLCADIPCHPKICVFHRECSQWFMLCCKVVRSVSGSPFSGANRCQNCFVSFPLDHGSNSKGLRKGPAQEDITLTYCRYERSSFS